VDFIEALRVMRRRWLVTLIGFLLTVSGGLAAVLLVPTNHQASGQLVLLLPPDAVPANGKTNPFLNLDTGLTFAGSLIISSVTTKQTERDMAAAGFTSDYSVAITPGAGPVLTVTVEDDSADRALATRSEVIRRLEVELDQLQPTSRVPRNQLITALPNAVSTVAEPLPGNKLRALAVIGVVGLALTLVVVFLRDRRLRVRAARRAQVLPDEPAEDEPDYLAEEWEADSDFSAADAQVTPADTEPDVASELPDPTGDLDPAPDDPAAAPGPNGSMTSLPGGEPTSDPIFPPTSAATRRMARSDRRRRALATVPDADEEIPEAKKIEELTGAQRTDG
jgi:hypothetical protein